MNRIVKARLTGNQSILQRTDLVSLVYLYKWTIDRTAGDMTEKGEREGTKYSKDWAGVDSYLRPLPNTQPFCKWGAHSTKRAIGRL